MAPPLTPQLDPSIFVPALVQCRSTGNWSRGAASWLEGVHALQQWGGGGGLGICGESGCRDWAALREAAADRMHSLHLLGYTAAGYAAGTWEGSLYWTAAVICAVCVVQGVLMPVAYARVWGRRLTRASCFAACFGVSVGGTWLLVLGPLGCLLLVQVFARAVRSDVNGGSDYGDAGVGRPVATLLCAVGCCVCALMVCGVGLYSRLRLAPRWYVKGQCGERAVQQNSCGGRLLSYGAWFALGRGYVGPVQLRRACYPLVAWYDRAHWVWATLPLWPGSMAVAVALVASVAEAVAGDEGKEGAGAVCYGGCFVLAGLHVAVGAWVGLWKRPFRSPLAGLVWLVHWVCIGMHHLFHGIVAMRVEGAEDEAELARLFTTGGGRVVTWWSYYDEAGGDATWFEWALYMSTVFLLLHIALTCVWCASAVCVFVADSPVGPWLPHVNRDLSFGAMEEERLDAEAATMMARGRLAEAGMLLLQRQRLYDGALSEWRVEGGISPQVMAEWKRVSVRYAACRGHNPKRAVRVAQALSELPQQHIWYLDPPDNLLSVNARAMSAAFDRCTKWHDQCPSKRRAALEDAPQLVSVDVGSWSPRSSSKRRQRKLKETNRGRRHRPAKDRSPYRVSPPSSTHREGVDDFSDAFSAGQSRQIDGGAGTKRQFGGVKPSKSFVPDRYAFGNIPKGSKGVEDSNLNKGDKLDNMSDVDRTARVEELDLTQSRPNYTSDISEVDNEDFSGAFGTRATTVIHREFGVVRRGKKSGFQETAADDREGYEEVDFSGAFDSGTHNQKPITHTAITPRQTDTSQIPSETHSIPTAHANPNDSIDSLDEAYTAFFRNWDHEDDTSLGVGVPRRGEVLESSTESDFEDLNDAIMRDALADAI